MTVTLDEAVADPQQTIAELRRQLDERTAERDEALEQQTATAEVLQVINSSLGDLAPVFDAMLEKATVLCEAEIGTLWTYDGEWMHASASRGASPVSGRYGTVSGPARTAARSSVPSDTHHHGAAVPSRRSSLRRYTLWTRSALSNRASAPASVGPTRPTVN